MGIGNVGKSRTSAALREAGAAPDSAPTKAPKTADTASDPVTTLAPGPLGGAKRPPAGAVALPALGGRPKVETFETTWKALDAAFAATKPETLEAAIGMLGDLGFAVSKADHNDAKLRRGDFEVRIHTDQIGLLSALHVRLEGPEKRGADEIDRGAVVMGGALVPKKLFERMKDRFDEVVDDFRDAVDKNGKKPLPTTFDGLKSLIDAGRSAKARAKDAVEDTEVDGKLAALTQKLESLRAQGLAPKNIVVYTDGPDGAGKSSTGAIVLQAIAQAGYATDAVSFKAPTPAEREQHWLQRFRDRGVPEGASLARFWDRGPAGDAVYGKKSPAQVKEMAKELRGFERELANDGVLLFKVHIFADQKKQAETFGKRLGRQAAANLIEAKLESSGKITDATRAALDNIRSKIDGDDLRALVNFDTHQASFLRFSKAAGYNVVDATDRHAARLQIIDALSKQLDAYAAKAAAAAK